MPDGVTDRRRGGFDPHAFEWLSRSEDESFWFRSRNELILWAIDRYAGDPRSIVEVGCGTGYVLAALAQRHPTAQVIGIELYPEGIEIARDRVPDAELHLGDAALAPRLGRFDVVGAFDVLEHIADDRLAIRKLAEAVNPGGVVVVTVPQHPALWSDSDDQAHHARRYVRNELSRKFEQCGLTVLRTTSFVTVLLPFMVAARLRPHAVTSHLALPRFLDRSFGLVMAMERRLIYGGATLPVGGSLLLVATRR